MRRWIVATITSVALFGTSQICQAVVLDLTTGDDGHESGYIDTTYFEAVNFHGAGKRDFLTIQGATVQSGSDGSEQGYNTTSNQGPWDTQPRSEDILVGDVPVVIETDGDGEFHYYFEFYLNLNEETSLSVDGSGPYISLDELQLFTLDSDPWDSPTAEGLDFGGYESSQIYDMGDDTVLLDIFRVETTSGGSDVDLRVLIPIPGDDPSALDATDHLVMYTMFGGSGGDYISDDGVEIWYFSTDLGLRIGDPFPDLPVPEPSSLTLWSMGLLVGVGWHARRRRRARRGGESLSVD